MYRIPRRRKEVERKNYLIMKRQFNRANRPVFEAVEGSFDENEALNAVRLFDTAQLRKGLERIVELSAKDAIERALDGFSKPATKPKPIIKSRASQWVELQALDDLYSEFIREYKSNIGAKITEIRRSHYQYLREMVNDQIQQGFAEGLSFGQMKRNILKADSLQEYFDSDGDYRVRRIVATETTMAGNMASLHVSEQLNKTVPLYKEWNAIIDGKARANHVSMHGTKVPINDTFTVPRRKGGSEQCKGPGDPNLSAENVIWCRCYITYGELSEMQAQPQQVQPTVPAAPKPPKPKPPKPPKPKPTSQDFSYRPPGKARFDKAFKSAYKARTRAEIRDAFEDMFKKNGYDTDIVLSTSLTEAQYAERVAAYERLLQEWDISKAKNKATISNIKLSFQSTDKKFGSVGKRYIGGGKYQISINAGDKTSGYGIAFKADGEAIQLLDPDFFSWRLGSKSTYARNLEEVSTQTHEFAHLIVADYRQIELNPAAVKKFFKEVAKIRTRYLDEVDDLKVKVLRHLNNKNPVAASKAEKELQKIYLGRYAEHVYKKGELDEFWAESFKNYYLSAKPSPYAEELVELARTYFGKTQ